MPAPSRHRAGHAPRGRIGLVVRARRLDPRRSLLVELVEAFLELLLGRIDLVGVLAAGLVVDQVAQLVDALVDLVAVLAKQVLGLVEHAHDVAPRSVTGPQPATDRGTAPGRPATTVPDAGGG